MMLARPGAHHGPAANPRKTTTVRKLGPVDIVALQAAVLVIPEHVWDAENAGKPNKFEVLDDTRHIVLRFIDGPRDWRGSHDRPAWPQWRGLLEPVLAEAVRGYGYPRGVFPRVMLARMAAGGVIHPHVDANPAAKWPHKIHLPVSTNAGVVSFFGGEEHYFPPGEAVEVNNLGPHWVRNGGDTDRVHLIFEYYDADQPEPDWLEPFLLSGAAR
ncbi:aspartyl/asparaginyl beta-hydroxylase domain-containing protein [Sphingomonas sp. QA11]|uniref:aspartyl/asparaginyl beta-hydroxylase domain-containing protein n=1 Tax=Sphingomonas sp. QA11 TaxID=2950605 RepID=UPI00234B73C8|nr:aspartyl/asparaginyl beta-hydroxylase domain-containing protein [Sphingomonas sp. QA11]WCM26653.1 aspartyl/asparaginyl beta-hydroxylase domain-containing protein [Sphingomonas sp. QA11]